MGETNEFVDRSIKCHAIFFEGFSHTLQLQAESAVFDYISIRAD